MRALVHRSAPSTTPKEKDFGVGIQPVVVAGLSRSSRFLRVLRDNQLPKSGLAGMLRCAEDRDSSTARFALRSE
jgi:hypothetical protein